MLGLKRYTILILGLFWGTPCALSRLWAEKSAPLIWAGRFFQLKGGRERRECLRTGRGSGWCTASGPASRTRERCGSFLMRPIPARAAMCWICWLCGVGLLEKSASPRAEKGHWERFKNKKDAQRFNRNYAVRRNYGAGEIMKECDPETWKSDWWSRRSLRNKRLPTPSALGLVRCSAYGGCRPISKQWELGILYTRDKFHAPPYYEFALCHLVVVEDLIKLFPII